MQDGTRRMSDNARLIGNSKAGRRFIAQTRLYNAGDFKRLRQFIHSSYYDLVLMQNPAARRLLDLKATRRLHGRLKVARVEAAEDYAIKLILEGEASGAELRLELHVSDGYPHPITHYSLLPVEADEAAG